MEVGRFYGLHPTFVVPSDEGIFEIETQYITPCSLISGNEMPYIMGLPRKSVQGVTVLNMAEFGRNVLFSSGAPNGTKIEFGNIYHMGEMESGRVRLDLESFRSHCFITGSTGSGKSNTTYRILDEMIGHQIPFLVVEPAKGEYKRYLLTEDGISPRLYPGQTKHLVHADSDEHDEQGLITESGDVRNKMMEKRMLKLQGIIKELEEPDFFGSDNSEVLLVGWGSTWGPIKEAIELLNKETPNKYSALVFGDVYPLPEKLLTKHAKTAKAIINVEQNATGQLAGLIRETTGIVCTDHVLKYDGRQITAEEIVKEVKEVKV